MKDNKIARYIVEFIGTFFLVLTIGAVAINSRAGNFAPLAIGAVLIAMIYAGAHISGAHYNPAVTLAFWFTGKCGGKCNAKDFAMYIIVQIFGALAAAFVVLYLKDRPELLVSNLQTGKVLVSEVIFTFALCFVILYVAKTKNILFGVVIGLTVVASIYAVGEISGAVFNPAVAAGLTAMGLSSLSNIWLYLVANFAGGILAVLVFNFLNFKRNNV
ncbi:MAG: MIP/aquaporin family protein [Thermodesulfobacteriota bacterium]